jgi:hypothetical protein
MRFSDGFAHTILCSWNGYEMCVIGHQTIGPDINITTTAPFRHQIYVLSVVIITKKCFLPAIPALRYMMWESWNYYPCYTCHN